MTPRSDTRPARQHRHLPQKARANAGSALRLACVRLSDMGGAAVRPDPHSAVDTEVPDGVGVEWWATSLSLSFSCGRLRWVLVVRPRGRRAMCVELSGLAGGVARHNPRCSY
jgi:hypothetical protein